MKKVILFLVSLITLILIVSNASAVFIGIVDGYVKNVTGGAISGSLVAVTVTSCSGGSSNGCTGNSTSASDGYYIVNNLNLPTLGAFSVSATEGTGSGSASGTANAFQIGAANITICYPPTTPIQTAVPDAHNTTAIFNWTSGTDPLGFPKYDQFDLDGNTTNQSSPVTRTSLNVSSHTWKARTCNAVCCSSFASDTFAVNNTAPTAPNNTNSSDLGNNITALTWTSGNDSDGDATYDQFKYSNGTVVTTTSPFNVSSAQLISWSVRTCDSFGECSSYNDVNSIVCSATSTTCPSCSSGGGGGGGGGSSGLPGTTTQCQAGGGGGGDGKKAELFCNGIQLGNETILRIKLDLKNGRNKISIYGINYNLENIEYCPWCYDGIKNQDEEQVDCGGSCRSCTKLEPLRPVVEKYVPWNVVIVSVVVMIGALAFILFRVISYFQTGAQIAQAVSSISKK